MSAITSLLIVIVLAGNPVIKLACDLSCQAKSDATNPADIACHGAHSGSRQTIQGTPDICPSVITAGPFLTETTQRASSSPDGTLAAVAVSSVRFGLLRHTDGAFLLRGDPGPPNTHTITVLRI